jgi:hypothetical protein
MENFIQFCMLFVAAMFFVSSMIEGLNDDHPKSRGLPTVGGLLLAATVVGTVAWGFPG